MAKARATGNWPSTILTWTGVIVALYATIVIHFDGLFRISLITGHSASVYTALLGILDDPNLRMKHALPYTMFILLYLGPMFAVLSVQEVDRQYAIRVLILLCSLLAAIDSTSDVASAITTLTDPKAGWEVDIPMFLYEAFALLCLILSALALIYRMIKRIDRALG
jgi:hypothetical protein